VAAAWNSPAAATFTSSCLNGPHAFTIALTSARGLAGNSRLVSANICCAARPLRNSSSLSAFARFFACAVTPAPDTLTCVPVVC